MFIKDDIPTLTWTSISRVSTDGHTDHGQHIGQITTPVIPGLIGPHLQLPQRLLDVQVEDGHSSSPGSDSQVVIWRMRTEVLVSSPATQLQHCLSLGAGVGRD